MFPPPYYAEFIALYALPQTTAAAQCLLHKLNLLNLEPGHTIGCASPVHMQVENFNLQLTRTLIPSNTAICYLTTQFLQFIFIDETTFQPCAPCSELMPYWSLWAELLFFIRLYQLYCNYSQSQQSMPAGTTELLISREGFLHSAVLVCRCVTRLFRAVTQNLSATRTQIFSLATKLQMQRWKF